MRWAGVGPRLPEPLLTAPDVAEDVELADSVSIQQIRSELAGSQTVNSTAIVKQSQTRLGK